jgi:hypothetical protein
MEALAQPFDPGLTVGEFAPAELGKKSSSIPGETPLETSETLPTGPSSSTQESVRGNNKSKKSKKRVLEPTKTPLRNLTSNDRVPVEFWNESNQGVVAEVVVHVSCRFARFGFEILELRFKEQGFQFMV